MNLGLESTMRKLLGVRETRRRGIIDAFGFAEEEENEEEHQENAESCDAKDIFQTQVRVGPVGNERPGSAADVDHGVVNGIADGADILLGGACSSAHHARLNQRDAQGGKNQDASHEQAKRKDRK